MKTLINKVFAAVSAAAFALGVSQAVSAADVIIINLDPPGAGLNDPTPATPIGGNAGVTVGDQRLISYQKAADIWGETLESSVPVFVGASFQPLPCSATGGVLGSAGPTYVFSDPAPAPAGIVPDTWYHSALYDAITGSQAVNDIDIITFFNSNLGSTGCLQNSGWYYGLDGNEAPNEIDFLSVVSHEIAHGLGFSEFASEATGQLFLGLPDIYSRNMLDTGQGKIFADMTDAERLQAQVSGENLVWNGPSVSLAAPDVLGPRPTIRILRPKSLKGTLSVQQASFGPPLRVNGGLTGQVKLVDDGVGAGADGCEPIKTNLNGKIALIDRGACAFTTKVLNAQAAGAKGAIVANNQPGGPAPMGGFSPFVTIPSVGVSLDQGNAIKGELDGGVNLKLILDSTLLAGANDDGLVRLYAPNPVQPGSSKSHWDTSAIPNLLMEPSINADLAPTQTLDLTPNLFEDIGWVLQ